MWLTLFPCIMCLTFWTFPWIAIWVWVWVEVLRPVGISGHIFRARTYITYSVRWWWLAYLRNETRRKPTTGTRCPIRFYKWPGIFYMPSRTDTAGHWLVRFHWRHIPTNIKQASQKGPNNNQTPYYNLWYNGLGLSNIWLYIGPHCLFSSVSVIYVSS